MIIKQLTLNNFRNYSKRKIDLAQDITLIKGSNGSGKTNILEAIYVAATSNSFKARYDKDMIKFGSDFCTITSTIEKNDDTYELEVQIISKDMNSNTSTKKTKVNKVGKRQVDYNAVLNAVIFSPQDMDLLSGSPSERRKFIDLLLSQTDRNYKKELSAYIKSMKQRNKILEQIRETGHGTEILDIWTNTVLTYGVGIQKKRSEMFDAISDRFCDISSELDKGRNEYGIRYQSKTISAERLLQLYNAEISTATTLVGPHKDDFTITMNGRNLAEFGSRGQQRSAVLALKITEIEYIQNEIGERPVLLLDDIYSELDQEHKASILSQIIKQQTIITTAEDIPALEGAIGSKNILTISG